jgi:hypothetical protein
MVCTLSTFAVYFIYFEVLYLPNEVLYLPNEVLYLPQHPLSLTRSKADEGSPIYLYTYTRKLEFLILILTVDNSASRRLRGHLGTLINERQA